MDSKIDASVPASIAKKLPASKVGAPHWKGYGK